MQPENLESWLAWREGAERPVPGYVEEESHRLRRRIARSIPLPQACPFGCRRSPIATAVNVLRNLEDFCRAKPMSAAGYFVLGRSPSSGESELAQRACGRATSPVTFLSGADRLPACSGSPGKC